MAHLLATFAFETRALQLHYPASTRKYPSHPVPEPGVNATLHSPCRYLIGRKQEIESEAKK